MGEARRRLRVAAIGAEISWSDDRRKAAIREPKFITIGELEDMARAYMANDPVTFVPAKAFMLERQEQVMSDGSSVQVMVKVHPDPRVQRVLYQMREAPLLNAMAEVDADRRRGGRRFDAVRRGRPAWARLFSNEFRQATGNCIMSRGPGRIEWRIGELFAATLSVGDLARHAFELSDGGVPTGSGAGQCAGRANPAGSCVAAAEPAGSAIWRGREGNGALVIKWESQQRRWPKRVGASPKRRRLGQGRSICRSMDRRKIVAPIGAITYYANVGGVLGRPNFPQRRSAG